MTGFKRTARILTAVAAVASVGLLMGCPAPVPPTPPTVAVSAAPASGQQPLTVVATATVSDGTPGYSYQWTSVPGGVIALPTAASTNILYAIAGTYTVTCTVTDAAGQTASGSATVTVTAPPPPPALAVTVTPATATVEVGDNAALTAAATGGTAPYSFQWALTSGPVQDLIPASADSALLTVVGTNVGTTGLQVLVTDADGATATATASVEVTAGPPAPSSQTFTLNCDNLNAAGTAGDDTFTAPLVFDTGLLRTTLQSCDQANGNGGNDTLNATINAVFGVPAPTLVGIQTININDQDGIPLDATNISGATVFNTVTSAAVAPVIGIQNIVNAGIQNTNFGLTMTYLNATTLGGASDAMALSLSGAGSTLVQPNFTLTTAGLETLNIASDGAAKNRMANVIVAGAGLKTVGISGTQPLDILGAIAGAAATITIDASTSAGVTLNAPAGSGVTFTGGAGNDTIRFAAGDLGANDTLNGGAGTNTLGIADVVLNPPAAALKTAINGATSFQTLELTGAGWALDVDQVAPFAQFLASGGGANAAINVVNANTFTYNANAGAQTFAKKNALNNTLGVALDGTSNPVPGTTVTLAALVSDQTTVNLTSNGTNGNVVTVLASALNATTNILGTKDLQIDGMVAAGTVAAGTFGGKLTVVGSVGNDAITGSPQDDKIRGALGVDAMAGGGGADAFRWNVPAEAPVAVFGSTDLVNDFVSGTDKLSFDGAAFGLIGGNTIAAANVATGGVGPTKNVVSITSAAATLSAADAATAIGSATAAYAAGDVVLFIVHNATDTAVFLFTSAAADATVTAAELGGNPIISIVGVTNVNATTDVTLTAVFP